MDMLDSDYKSGFVAVMGRPNVGKSTLINALLGQKIAAVSPRPQTTRKRQMGILTLQEEVHGQNAQMEESDAILFVVDASEPIQEEDQLVVAQINRLKKSVPLVLALNKIDRIEPETLAKHREDYLEVLPQAQAVAICATRGDNLDLLQATLLEHLPPGPPFFPTEQLTDLYEREIAADLIREAALKLLRDEVPHGIAVRIDQYKERDDHGAYIEATLFVERDSHKPIVIGSKGTMLKKIGTLARQEIESMSGRKVYVRIRVKVRKSWRDDENVLRRFGFS
jgi:GTP-binding protein Era